MRHYTNLYRKTALRDAGGYAQNYIQLLNHERIYMNTYINMSIYSLKSKIIERCPDLKFFYYHTFLASVWEIDLVRSAFSAPSER